jgi:hypothetical protein
MYLPDNLVKARHDDLIQAAARSCLAARTRRPTAPDATA